jgi:hypothetical protein
MMVKKNTIRHKDLTRLYCFFCNEPPGPKGLHVALTLGMHHKVHFVDLHFNETNVLRKPAKTDMVAGDVNTI